MKPRITIQAIESLAGDGLFFGGDAWNSRFASAWPNGGMWAYTEIARGTYTLHESYEEAQAAALAHVMGGIK